MNQDIGQADAAYSNAQLNVADILRILVAQRWIIAAAVFLVTGLSIVVAYILPVTYRAEVLLQPVQTDNKLEGSLGGLGGIAGLVGLQLGNDDKSAEAQATLESKAFTMQFIRDHNLLPILFHNRWDATAQRWSVSDPKKVPVELDGYRLFRDSIRTVTQDRQTRLVLLSIEWTDADQAATWANEMVVRLNEQMRADALARSRQNLEFLKKEYDATNLAVVRDTIGRVIESELKSTMLASVQKDFAFRVIDPAFVPNRRYSPNRPLVAVIGMLLGFSLGIAVALARGGNSQIKLG